MSKDRDGKHNWMETAAHSGSGPVVWFFFQAEDGIRDYKVTGGSDVCSSDLATMIWFSASWTLIILPNSVGLPGFPLRMISVVCSNRLTILPSDLVMPLMIRARVWLTTCFTRGSIVSISFFMPSRAACCNTSEERLTPCTISCEKRLA